MSSQHPSEPDSAATDSVASSPRSDHVTNEFQSRVRFMCSFGGKILPRPHDNQLRYVGGDTRIVAVHRNTTFSALIAKISKLSGTNSTNITVKYQLPNEDLDALISVSTDEDVENMLEEYDRLVLNQNLKSSRLRLFLFRKADNSRTSSISSLLDGSANRGHWFSDALNGGGAGLERNRSEASSILSEVPDYLFGLDNSDENHPREMRVKNRLASDPGSPAPVVSSSPFCSTLSAVCVQAETIPDLPPVKTKPGNPFPVLELKESQVEGFVETGGGGGGGREIPISQPGEYPGNPRWQYIPDPHYPNPQVQQIPVYYIPGQIPSSNFQVQHVPIQAPYVQQYGAGFNQPVPGMGQIYGGGVRPMAQLDPYSDGLNQQVYYGVRNTGFVASYPGLVVPAAGGEEMQVTGTEGNMNRIS